MMNTPALPPLLTAAWLGVAAGLAVAIPLGPIGLLIVDRGMRHGRRIGLAAAAGVATTDLMYAVVALTATAWAARVIEPVARPATYLAAAVIATIGMHGFLRSRGELVDGAAAVPAPPPARPVGTFAGFAALTAINPATVLYFSALTLALTDHLDVSGTRAVFAAGAGLGSFSWQAALAVLGARLGRRPRPRLERYTRQAGSLVLLVLAVVLAAGAA